MRFVPVKGKRPRAHQTPFHAAAKPGILLCGMLTRKPPMLVRVALANKTARIVWALMARGGVYNALATTA